ncbi:hypothetical protein PInf_008641 [Phytophthora infestans]|nr:hypothetical protein PInf_008641 [Phytophthora infestans]
MYQVIAFRFCRQILSLFSVTASSPIQSTWAKVTPLNEGISEMILCLVTFVSLWIVRRYGLHWSWKLVVVVCQFGVVFVDAFPTFLTIWNVYRSQWFWLAHPRFTRLRELHPEISIDQNGYTAGSGSTAGPRKLASSLIKVSIIPMSMQATSFEPLVKKIPQQMKISQLKVLIETKFGVQVPAQVLSFRTDSRDGSEVLVNDNE